MQYSRVAPLSLVVPPVQAGKVGVSIHAQIDLLKDEDHMYYTIPPYELILQSRGSVLVLA